MACCQCCELTGACCLDGVCTQETCAECEALGGKFQGVDTECVGESENECPCDPPADPDLCQKCVDGEVVTYCPSGQECCNGACQPEPCCTCQNVDASEDCGIESVAFDIDIVFPTCFKGPGYASTVGTGTVVLQASDSFISSADGVSIPNEDSECSFRVDAAMLCASTGESPFGGLAGRWYLNVTVTGGSEPETRCCNWLCEDTSLAAVTVDFPLATNQSGEFCCPAPFDELTVDNSNQIFTNFPVANCGDWYIRLYNLNIVYT